MEKRPYLLRISIHTLLLISAMAILQACGPADETHDKEDFLHLDVQERTWTAHVRGLYMVNDDVAWASGSTGHFMRCIDGTHWTADTIPGYGHLDFRDVHAFDAENALVMASGVEGVILRTEDGGKTWKEVYANRNEGIFLDGMDFKGEHGFCYGDPVNGKTLLLESNDGGLSWLEISAEWLPHMLVNEAGFAASGTGICLLDNETLLIATGGAETARVFRSNNGAPFTVAETALFSEEGCGIFSLAFKDPEKGVAVGGCYLDSTRAEGNCAYTVDGGKTWIEHLANPPAGYRSCVSSAPASNFYLACGRTGIDYSLDDGMNWIHFSDDGYFTSALGERQGWLMGRNGKLAKLTW